MTSVNFLKRVQPPRSDGATDHWAGKKKPHPPETRDCYYATHEELCPPPSFRRPSPPSRWEKFFGRKRRLREASEIVEKAGRLHQASPVALRYFFDHDLDRLMGLHALFPKEVEHLLEEVSKRNDDPQTRPWIGLVRTACAETDGFLDLISLLE